MKIQFALKMGFLLTLACACKKESLPPIVLPEPFFFYATTFDSGGNPLISDWNFFNDYSLMGPPYDTLVPSTCPDNGGWALNIQAQRNGTSFAEKYFTHLPGNKRIKLTFFAALYFGQNATSFVLRQIRNGSEVKSAQLNPDVWNDWQLFTLEETFSFLATDSLQIKFSGTGNTYETSRFLVDAVRLREF